MKHKIVKISSVIFVLLSAVCLAAAAYIGSIGAEDEIVYFKGLAAEHYVHLALSCGTVCLGVCAVFMRHIRSFGAAAGFLFTLLATAILLGGILFLINTLADKHRYYMYNNMYNYGNHRIIRAKDGDYFVLYQQNGEYTFKEFYRSETSIASPDILWGKEYFGVVIGEDYSDPEGISPIVEWFEYSEYNS